MVGTGLWIRLSLRFGAQKRLRCRGWLDEIGVVFDELWIRLSFWFGARKRFRCRVGWKGSHFGSVVGNGLWIGLSSRSGLAHKSIFDVGVSWKGSDSGSVVATGLWIRLSFGFGPRKRLRYRGLLANKSQ